MATIPHKTKEHPKETSKPRGEDSEVLVLWQAPKYMFYANGALWYGLVITSAVLVIALTFLLRAYIQVSPWLVAAVIGAGAGALISRGVKQPDQGQYGLTENGFVIEGEEMPFESFRSFAVIDLTNHHVLRLWPKQRFYLPTSIVIDDSVNPDDLREFLAHVLPEEEHQQTFSDIISHLIRF